MRTTLLASLTLLAAFWSRPADACGCFTPPDPTVPLVQAGERILFAVDQGQVTAHIQVQYAGASASDFGWLLPLPSVPTLELGTDELFARLISTTQPSYRLSVSFDSSCRPFQSSGGGTFGGGTGGASGSSADAGSAGPPLVVVVVQDSVGPYDYAVLRGDSKTEMLAWLSANRYFVPAGTDDAVTPYIHEGGFFLALKLRPGATTGDLQPVVLRYASDFGVIPITLTSTGAQDNMGVQVWMLGAGRAIPRNYQHTVLNDARIDWQRAGANYNDVVIAAVGEAPGHHTFVTEYAGAATPVRTAMLPMGRFGSKSELAAQPDASAFIAYLWSHGFASPSPLNPPWIGPSLSGTLKAILTARLPPPPGLDAESFYRSYDFYVSSAPAQDYQPAAMAEAIWERVVMPTQNAAALFSDSVTLTRLYTTLSPADMNRDPAFSFNPSLPNVSNVHQATMTVSCASDGFTENRAVLLTEQGWRLEFPAGRSSPPRVEPSTLPASLLIELLREEGPSEVVRDHRPKLELGLVNPDSPAPMTCSVVGPGGLLAALLLAYALRRR
jgi:hypothetical protein